MSRPSVFKSALMQSAVFTTRRMPWLLWPLGMMDKYQAARRATKAANAATRTASAND